FLDETSKDERTLFRWYGRAKRSQRAAMRGVFVCRRRLTAIGTMSCDGMIAGHVVEGSLTREGYLEFLENAVLPSCTAYPGKHSILIMDNARIHHGDEVQDLAQQ
ncbi:hypothetical protein PISMIDRAFT_66715, partial [Pisolithus microcarpus 441]